MLIFVNGGSGSGKSAFAESVAQKLGGKLIYVATMPIFSDDDRKKVERHHKLRAGKGFDTLEQPKRLADIPENGETVLIECMSTHVANMMFDPEILPDENVVLRRAAVPASEEDSAVQIWTKTIRKELEEVLARDGNTIIVSAEAGMDGASYSQETEQYRQVLVNTNRYLTETADAAFEVVCGIPVVIKGELPC